jgi:hypothetical protein
VAHELLSEEKRLKPHNKVGGFYSVSAGLSNQWQLERVTAQKVYWLTISRRGETGGKRPHKMKALLSAF